MGPTFHFYVFCLLAHVRLRCCSILPYVYSPGSYAYHADWTVVAGLVAVLDVCLIYLQVSIRQWVCSGGVAQSSGVENSVPATGMD